jgi:hypothetical protein
MVVEAPVLDGDDRLGEGVRNVAGAELVALEHPREANTSPPFASSTSALGVASTWRPPPKGRVATQKAR